MTENGQRTLTQHLGTGRTQVLSLDGDSLLLAENCEGKVDGGRVPLAAVDDNFMEVTVRSSGWLAAAAGALGLGIFAAAAKTFCDGQEGSPSQVLRDLGLTLVCILPGLLGLLLAWKYATKKAICLLYADNDAPMTVLRADIPDCRSVQDFLAVLSKEARRAREVIQRRAAYAVKCHAAATQLREVHTSWKNGGLTQDEYETRRRELLPIGRGADPLTADDSAAATAQITQRLGPIHTCTFTLYPNRIETTERTLTRSGRTFRHLDSLQEDPRPPRSNPDAPSYLLLAAVLIGLAVAACTQVYTGHRVSVPTIAAVLVLVGLGLAAGMVGVIALDSYVIFHSLRTSPDSPIPGFWIRRSSPSREAVADFIAKLRQANSEQLNSPSATWRRTDIPATKDILLEFAALCGDDIITKEEYSEAGAWIQANLPA